MFVDYTSDLDKKIRNVASLPRGLNCPYLLCVLVESRFTGEPDDVYVAKSWHRKRPTPKAGEVVVVFSRRSK